MGLHFKNKPDRNISKFMDSLTACIRFKFSNLGYKADTKPAVLLIDNQELHNRTSLLFIRARYPWNWVGIGQFSSGIGSQWLLRASKNNPDNVFKPMWWHHICFSFSSITGKVIFAMVGSAFLKHKT